MLKKIDGLRARALADPVIVALLILPFFKPMGLISLLVAADWALIAAKGVALLVIAAFFLARPRLSPVTVLLGVYQVLLLAGTVMNGGSLAEWAYGASGVAGVCLLMEQCVRTDVRALLRGVVFLMGGMCVLNLISIPFFPDGIRNEWGLYFMAADNGTALYIIPLMGMTAVYANDQGWPFLLQLGLMALFSASVFILWSATGMVAAAAFLALFVLHRIRWSGRLFNICTLYVVFAVGFVLIVVLRATDKFAFLIENVLHKDVTLTLRLGIWDNALAAIAQKPLLGYGLLPRATIMDMLTVTHCHNFILQVLFQAGAVGLAVYLAIFGLVAWPLMRRREHYVGYFLSAAIFALLVDFLAEVPIYPLPFTSLLVLSWHAEKLVAALKPQES